MYHPCLCLFLLHKVIFGPTIDMLDFSSPVEMTMLSKETVCRRDIALGRGAASVQEEAPTVSSSVESISGIREPVDPPATRYT